MPLFGFSIDSSFIVWTIFSFFKAALIEDGFDFPENAEIYKEEELEDAKNYEEAEELVIKEELEVKVYTDAEEFVKMEVGNEGNEDFSRELKEDKEDLETELVPKEELLVIKKDTEGEIEK